MLAALSPREAFISLLWSVFGEGKSHHNELQGTSKMPEAADHKHIPRNPIPPLQNEKLLTHTRPMKKRSLEQCVPASLGEMEILSTPQLLGCLIVPQP